MNKIEELYNKYEKRIEEFGKKIIPATENEINTFIDNCNKYNISIKIRDELVEYYKLNNNFFNYFTCDDPTIFEWYEEDKCLWLGQQDLWTFRCLINKHKYAIGAAGDISFGPEYEFDTIEEMLEGFLSEKYI